MSECFQEVHPISFCCF